MPRRSRLAGRLRAAALAPLAVTAAVAAVAAALGASPAMLLALALAAGVPAAWLAAARIARPWARFSAALREGVASLRAGDFSVRLAEAGSGELGDLVRVYNELAEVLAGERSALRQRELLLQGALEASPAAVVLVGESERVIYGNRAARVLFAGGARLEGRAMAELAAACPEALAAALATRRDALATVLLADGEETFQISHRGFELNRRRQRLIQVRRLTAALRRQEVAGWKKAIRIVSHEVRSGLAPIRSLARSARQLGDRGEHGRVGELLDDIDQAGAALQRFIEGYASFARLPEPRPETIELRGFLEHLRRIEPFAIDGELPAVALEADPGQLQQVLVNLLRNAREAGGRDDEISIAAHTDPRTLTLEVRDRGCGMDDEALERALAPFFSTKPDGSGLGLALCREILEAHGGDLRLAPRDGGGLVAACRLPLAADDGS